MTDTAISYEQRLAAELLTARYARAHSIAPARFKDNTLVVNALTDDDGVRHELELLTEFPARVEVVDDIATIREINNRVFGTPTNVGQTLSLADQALEEMKTKLVETRASSIFLEYARDADGADAGRVRMNMQGDLVEVMTLPFNTWDTLTNALLTESLSGTQRNPLTGQRGRLSWNVDGRSINLRLSSVPIYHESRPGLIRLVIRVLRNSAFLPPLEFLGILPHQKRAMIAHIHRARCTMLIGAPPGEGKSTSAYALLALLHLLTLNVITIEDPPEITFPFLTQIPIYTAQGWTTEEALTELFRQEPWLIFVGEILDKITAQLVMSGNKRGVRMISTFHADDALTIVPAMRNFGVDPYMLSGITALASQRLVQIICPSCRIPAAPSPELRAHLKRLDSDDDALIVYRRGKGCPHCNQRGIIRRLAIFELVELTPQMRAAIEVDDHRQLAKLARDAGYVTMLEECLIRILRGDVDHESLNRFPDVDAHAIPIGFGDTNGNYRDRLAHAFRDALQRSRSITAPTIAVEALAS
jgi:type II secretory ATPase GspE/PulE/Tfp pilus assembly ATPase PilB-like protein